MIERRAQRFGSTLRRLLFYATLVALPLATYFVFYVDSRIEQTEVRNFRALDAAAVRLEALISNLHQIAGNVPVGIPEETLAEILDATRNAGGDKIEDSSDDTDTLRKTAEEERLRRSITMLEADREIIKQDLKKFQRPLDIFQSKKFRRVDPDDQNKLEKIQSELSKKNLALERLRNRMGPDCSESETYGVLNTIHDISRKYLKDLRAINTATQFHFRPLALSEVIQRQDKEAEEKPKDCASRIARYLGQQLSTFSDPCSASAPKPLITVAPVQRRLIEGPDGVLVETRDCRTFSERSPALAAALPQPRSQLIYVLDQFGVGVLANLGNLVDSVADNVAPLFDQYLIADNTGRVLYSADRHRFRYEDVSGAPSKRARRLDFASHVDVAELVQKTEKRRQSLLSKSQSAFGTSESQAVSEEFERFGIHSRIDDFSIGDIGFRAFIHPFAVEGLNGLDASDEAITDATTLYMIGIVDRQTLGNESVKLRLSLVANALLALGVVFSSLAFVWLWTAGDRLTLSLRQFVLLSFTGVMASVLFTLLAAHIVTRAHDEQDLDGSLRQVAQNIQQDFLAELEDRLGTLAQATGWMMSAGEAPARLTGSTSQEPPAGRKDKTNITAAIKRNYFCLPEDPPPRPDRLETYPIYDLAFLMDQQGRQWQCDSHRQFDTRPIRLHFREYFKRPKANALWQINFPNQDQTPPPVFIDRITSILDGSTETVVAARPCALLKPMEDRDRHKDSCESEWKNSAAQRKDRSESELASAVMIGRFHSLESSILPPHMRYAVIENATGKTLFHSLGNRSLATNFVRETDTDDRLVAMIDARSSGFANLEYHGSPVRAFVRPLADGLPWTLVTYRDHELIDTLRVLTVSAAAAGSLGTVFPGVLILALFVLAIRRSSGHGWPWRETVLASDFVIRVRNALAASLGLSLAIFVTCWIMAPHQASIVAPLMALLPVLAVLLAIFLRQRKWLNKLSIPTVDEAYLDQEAMATRASVVSVLAMLVLGFAVLPTLAWYGGFRADFSDGAADYVRNQTINAITDRCKQQRAFESRFKDGSKKDLPADGFGTFQHGWTLLNSNSADSVKSQSGQSSGQPACKSFPGGQHRIQLIRDALPGSSASTTGWAATLIQTIGNFSSLGSDLAAHSVDEYNGGMEATTDARIRSPGHMFDELLGSRSVRNAGQDAWTLSVQVMMLSIGGCLIWFFVVSIADRVFAMRLRLGLLPPADISNPPKSWSTKINTPLAAFAVHRSESMWKPLLASMARQGWALKVLDWDGQSMNWETTDASHWEQSDDGNVHPQTNQVVRDREEPGSAPTLHVIIGFERYLIDESAGSALLSELEMLTARRAHTLICSRVLPGNWLANLIGAASGDISSASPELLIAARWSQLLGPFDVRRIVDHKHSIAGAFIRRTRSSILGGKDQNKGVKADEAFAGARYALALEAQAFPELLELAIAVDKRLANAQVNRSNLRAVALERFGAGAANHFHSIWSCCSRDERLQLLALASGGFVNPARATTLASLANRGLIAIDGLMRLRSRAFGKFILNEIEHEELLRWRDSGHENVWRAIWPPLLLIALLAGAFFVSSTPEALAPLAAVMAAGLGAVPVFGSLIRSVRGMRAAPSD